MSSYVYVKNPNGTTYVYENTTYWDKESKTCKHKRVSIGHLDPETNEVVPNRKKGDAARLRAALSLDQQAGGCTVSGIGLSMLLDKAAEDTGLRSVLKKVFRDDWMQMLTCAYYLVSDGGALCHIDSWMALYRAPYGGTLTSQRISELLIRITPSLQQDFFRSWVSKNKQDEYYAMDITSISSYGEFIQFVSWGYNRDGEDLPQVNMLMVTGEESRMPLYYRIIPGSIKDVSTLKDSLENLILIESGKMHLVMDKGFYSAANVDAMYAKHMKFMIGVPFTTAIAKKAVEDVRQDIRSHYNYCMVMEDELYAVSRRVEWNGHRCYQHVYFDSLKAELESKKLDHTLLCCYKELTSGQHVQAHEKYYKDFFVIKETPVRGIKVAYNEEAITEHKRSFTGWFVMMSNDVKDKVEALEIYRQKDAVEKNFDDLKNDLDMKRLRIHSNAAMDGRIFLQFLALILTTRLKQVMHQHDMFKSHDLQEMLNEMKTIREVRVENKRKKFVTALTGFQQQIIDAFGLVI